MKLPAKIREAVANTKYEHLTTLYYEALNADTILEIGIRRGFSTTSFLCGLMDGKRGHLWSIDWGENPQTLKTVDTIQRSELSRYFTWINRDVRSIPELWFREQSMDVVFPDLNVRPLTDILQNCLLSMHKGSKMFLLDVNRISEKEKFVANLDTDQYSFEIKPIRSGMAIIIKETDD